MAVSSLIVALPLAALFQAPPPQDEAVRAAVARALPLLQKAAAGHRELAALLFRRFGIFDAQSPTCHASSR